MSENDLSYKLIPSTCAYCGTGCGILLEVMDGRLIGTLPQKDHPVSKGALCLKGWSCHEFVYSPHRLEKPMIRRDGVMVECEWEEAIKAVAEGLQKVRDEYGPDAIGFFTSARCTNEENYLLQKFSRAVIGSNNVDHCARL